jgi:hypothetical protein
MRAVLMFALLTVGVFGQERSKPVGEIEFFGYSGIDLKKLEAALPFREGAEFKIEKKGELAKMIQKAEEAVQRTIGRPTTDIAPVCCDQQGRWILYIGFSGKIPRYHPQPKGSVRLPEDIIDLYKRFERELEDAIRRGVAEEDHSQGYAVSIDPSVRRSQQEMRGYALAHEALLRDVLENASDSQQRKVAAEILGYAPQSKLQVSALAHAARDEDRIVRNNATRALWILVESDPEIAMDIPEEFFIDLLLSGKWTDVNKAGLVLLSMTENRNEELLEPLRRKEVRERLIEMARWRTRHGECARYILGRMAGIAEERLKLLVASGQTEEILHSLTP